MASAMEVFLTKWKISFPAIAASARPPAIPSWIVPIYARATGKAERRGRDVVSGMAADRATTEPPRRRLLPWRCPGSINAAADRARRPATGEGGSAPGRRLRDRLRGAPDGVDRRHDRGHRRPHPDP